MVNDKKDRSSYYLKYCCLLAIATFIVCFLVFVLLSPSNINITNSNDVYIKSDSLTCEKEGIRYPLLANNLRSGTAKINATFNTNSLNTISMIYQVKYDDNAQVEYDETQSRIAMNKNFNDDNLGIGALGIVFSAFDEMLQLSLQADIKDINDVTAKYFLLDGSSSIYDRESAMEFYIDKGFDCY